MDHVLRFKDLEPGSWQARYALAAVKDGMFGVQREKFDPNDEITRGEFYAALVAAFHLGTPFTKNQFDSSVDALIDTGMLDAASRPRQEEHGRVTRSEALELILRCLDRGMAHGPSMGRIAADQLARDFNVQFAGKGAAEDAEREARKLAADETAARKTAAIARADQRAKDARRRGAPSPTRSSPAPRSAFSWLRRCASAPPTSRPCSARPRAPRRRASFPRPVLASFQA